MAHKASKTEVYDQSRLGIPGTKLQDGSVPGLFQAIKCLFNLVNNST